MTSRRDTSRDGFKNRLETYLLTNFGPVWRLLQGSGWLRRKVNRALTNRAILKTSTRPYAFSCAGDYTSWEALTDRTFNSRHLPPDPDQDSGRPSPEEAGKLFERRGPARLCPKSTVLFAYFAQWFTDGFLRSDRREPRDLRKNTSNHEIDLSQLYGLNREITSLIRSGHGGLLKSQVINGEEYPPYLCEGGEKKPEFEGLQVFRWEILTPEQRDQLFAMGGDRGNSQIGYVMMNVLFFREHNRVARLLAQKYPAWDDERLFQTARNVLIVLLIKVVIEEYINHIAPYHFKFSVDPSAFPNEKWYRPNWMAIEFNLLYRWHSLIPDDFVLGGETVPIGNTMWNTKQVTERGLGAVLEDSSRQPAGQVGLFNTNRFLLETEAHSVLTCRKLQLASYNAYRACCNFPRATEFDQISGNPEVQEALRRLYGHPDRIDYYVGLFAEDPRPNSVLPSLIGRLVGIDAFSQALTNPLLAPNVYKKETFSPLGMEIIEETRTLSDILHRNQPAGAPRHLVTMTRTDWKRV